MLDWLVVQWKGEVVSRQGVCSTQVAAARGYPKLLQKDLGTGIEIVLDRAGQVNPLQAPGETTQPASCTLIAPLPSDHVHPGCLQEDVVFYPPRSVTCQKSCCNAQAKSRRMSLQSCVGAPCWRRVQAWQVCHNSLFVVFKSGSWQMNFTLQQPDVQASAAVQNQAA